jgi:formate dehydrogenase major subunit
MLYNRASADLQGRPWSERKKWIWWDSAARKWTGYDTPDFPGTKPPSAPADPEGVGLAAHSGQQPFLMMPNGVGLLFNPAGLLDGPLPTHYEPVESPVRNALSLCHHDVPSHRALPRGRNESLEPVAR